MPAAVASRYARALVDVVLAPASRTEPDRVREDLRSFEQALAASAELANALASPAITRPRKRAVIERLGRGPATVMELARPFKMALPSFTQHLEMLVNSGLVQSKKSGRVRTFQPTVSIPDSENWRRSAFRRIRRRCCSAISLYRIAAG